MLITSSAQLREHITNLQSNLTFELIKPSIETAEELVAALIGLDVYEFLHENPTEEVPAGLLRKAQRAIALVGYQESQLNFLTQFGNAGLTRFLPKDAEKLSMWETDIMLADAARKADNALEGLMAYLDRHKSELPVWTNSTTYADINRLLIPSLSVLREAVPEAAASYRLFQALRPYIPRSENDYIAGVLGDGLYQKLKTAMANNDILTDAEGAVLCRSRLVLGPMTLYDALPFLAVRFFGDGIRIISSFKGLKDEKAVDSNKIDDLRVELLKRAEKAKGDLITYLNKTASADILPEYFTSGLYRDPNDSNYHQPDNKGKKHFGLYAKG